jgi:hypothetical protein
MEPILMPAPELDASAAEELRVRAWCTEQLGRLGLPYTLAYTFAGLVDWHAFADLVERGCPPELALEIIR